MVVQEELELKTSGNGEMHDLTDSVRGIVERSGITAGLVHVFNVGSTGVIGAIEFEPGLQEDLPAMLNRLMPPRSRLRTRAPTTPRPIWSSTVSGCGPPRPKWNGSG